MDTTSRGQLLLDKNAKLAAQVGVQRKELNDLSRKLQGAEKREESLNETVLAINRTWEELNSSIAFLKYRTDGSTTTSTINSNTPAPDTDIETPTFLQSTNPFLAKLLTSYGPFLKGASIKEAIKDITENPSDVEEQVRLRASDTLKSAATVLDKVEHVLSSNNNSSKSNAAPQLPSTSAAAVAEQAAQKFFISANKRLRDQALLDQVKIKELECSLADKDAVMSVYERKLQQGGGGGGQMNRTASQSGGGAMVGRQNSQQQQEGAGGEVGGGGGSGGGNKEVEAEMYQLRTLLEKRTAEADGKGEQLDEAVREAKRLKEDLESVKSSQKRVQDQSEARVNEIKKEFNAAAARVQEVQRESDDLKLRLKDLQLRLEKAHFSRARMDDSETQIRDLKRSLDKARQARDDARLSLDQERERVKAMPTITALKELMDAQEQGIKSIRAAAAQDKEAARDAAQVRGRLDVAERALSEKDAHIALLVDKLGKARAKLSRTRYVSEKEADLTLFMELTKQALVSTDGTDSSKTSPQALAAQLDVLQARVADLEKDLSNARKEATELQGKADEAERKYVEMKARCEAAEAHVKELADKIAKEEASSEELENQLEQMFSSHEETAERNKEMIETLRLTQEANVKLAREAQEAQMERAALGEQRREMDGERARNEEDAKKLNNRINELEQQQKRIMLDLEAAKKESQAMAKKCDAAVAQLKDKEHAVSSALKEAEAASLESGRRAVDRDDQETKARKEATKAERLQSEVDALKSRLHRMGASPQGLASELQQECDALRSLLNCPVCRTRQKNTLIMQCNHVFCEECVKVNLANRHRKCPSCNTRFGEGDVKTIYLTGA